MYIYNHVRTYIHIYLSRVMNMLNSNMDIILNKLFCNSYIS